MASLASYTTLYVTSIRLEEPLDLKCIVAVRWDAGDRVSEESSVTDFIGWLAPGDARAFVRLADGSRGPRIRIDHDGVNPYLRSRSIDSTGAQAPRDALLQLPRWQVGKPRRHMSHR